MSSNGKKILIVADGFGAPSYTPRLRALGDYLCEKGWDVDVVVEYIQPLSFTHKYVLDEVKIYSGSKIDWTIKNIWSLLTDWKNRMFSNYVERHYGEKHYDAVFCSTFHTFPLRAAIEFGEKHHIPVTLDLRDIVEQAPKNAHNYLLHHKGIERLFVGLFTRINLQRRNHWLTQATNVISVSPWHVEQLKQHNQNTHLVYNGFDKAKYYFEAQKTGNFILSYTGKFFGKPIQDPTLLFEALCELQEEINFQLVCHTNPEGKIMLQDWIKRYNLKNCVIEDYLPTEATITLYHQSSIMLIFSNTASDRSVHGMMTTKFYEALGVEKPVLCVRSDEECLATAIAKTNAGLAAKRVEDIKEFIKEKYKEWETKGYTHQAVKDKERFSRQEETKQIEKILLA